MKKPTTASLKNVTAENLVALGPDRLAELLVAAAEKRLKPTSRVRKRATDKSLRAPDAH